MPDEKATDAHQRFANDLRRIRESYGLSIDDLHQFTKVPRGLIEEFEENALVGHPMFNRVYLRSLARAYAGQLDLSPGVTLRALEQAQAGEYENELADEYLEHETPSSETEEEGKGEEASAESEQPHERPAAEEEDAPPDVEEQATPGEQRASHQEAEAQTASPGERQAESKSPVEREAHEEEAGAATAGAAAGEAASPSGSEESAQEAGQQSRSRSPRSSSTSRTERRRGRGGGVPNWVWGVALLVVVGGGIALFVLFSGNGGAAEQQASEAPVAQDTSRQAPAGQTQAASVEPVQIGDSLDFRVIAARGPVRELRVKPDDDLRRPYWIEEGDSKAFRAKNKIIFQNAINNTSLTPLQNIDLQLEGEPYPTDRRDAEGRIVVTRQSAQAYLDSLARQ